MEDHSLTTPQPMAVDSNVLAELLTPGEFPEDSFNQETRSIMDYHRDQFGVPPAATAMCLLSVLSAAIGPFVVVSNGSEYGDSYLNIWCIIVAAKSSGKSKLLNDIACQVVEANREMEELFRMNILPELETEIEGLEYTIQQAKNREHQNTEAAQTVIAAKKTIKRLRTIRPPRLIVETATCESLKNTVANTPDHFTFCMSGEGAAVLKVMFGKYDRKKSPEIDTWLSLKTGDFTNDTRIGRESVTICNGRLAMLLMVQPIVAHELMEDREAILRGLLTRMYMFDPKFDRQKAIRHEVPRPNMRIFRGILRHHLDKRQKFMETSILENREKTGDDIVAQFTERIVCDGDAREIFANFHDEGLAVERCLVPVEPAFDGECGRWREDAIQIAGLLAAIKEEGAIDGLLAQQAVNIVRWCKKSFLMMFLNPYFDRIDDRCERLMDIIESSPDRQISLRILKNNHTISEKDIIAIQAVYPQKFMVETVKSNTGRPSKVVRICNGN
jgi:hypothetical protein